MTPFVKLQGAGNDFVLLDRTGSPDGAPLPHAARRFCDRRFGIGADGLLVASREDGRLRYRMFNPDGTEAEACGNGLRCFAVWAMAEGHLPPEGGTVLTAVGESSLTPFPGGAEVGMGRYRLAPEEIPANLSGPEPLAYKSGVLGTGVAVGMGNPHVVFTVPRVDAVDLAAVAGVVQADRAAFPNGVNVHLVQPGEPPRVRHFERGAGETLACGSGACAVAVALLSGRPGMVPLSLPGGEVVVTIGPDREVRLAGPAVRVFDGEWTLD